MEFCLTSHLFLLLNETLKDPLDVGFNVNKVSAWMSEKCPNPGSTAPLSCTISLFQPQAGRQVTEEMSKA